MRAFCKHTLFPPSKCSVCVVPEFLVLFTFLTCPPGFLPPHVPSALYMSRQFYLSIMTPASSVCREFQMNASASRRGPLVAYHARDQIKAPALCGASLSRQLIIKSSHHTPHLFPDPQVSGAPGGMKGNWERE